MSRDWKPGDVGVFSAADGERRCIRLQSGWWYLTKGGSLQPEGDVRPLVVIDPEGREQVARLVELLVDNGWRCTTAHGLRDALREFANPTPPKPAEPTGLGAVVEDNRGERYTRYDSNDPQAWWHNYNGSDSQLIVRRYAWDDFDAVRVLSEGVAQ